MREGMRKVVRGVGLLMVLTAMSGLAVAVPPEAPEIDPGSMVSALTLLSGGLLLLTGRRRKS